MTSTVSTHLRRKRIRMSDKRVLVIEFDEPQQFDQIFRKLQGLFPEDNKVVVHAAIKDVAEKVLAAIREEPSGS